MGDKYCIDYTEIFPNGKRKKHREDICFSSMYGGGYGDAAGHPNLIKYYATIKDLTGEEVDYFNGFLSNILDGKLFKYKRLKNNNRVIYILDCKGLNRKQALLYLTAFRNIDEFSSGVKELFKYKDLSIEKQFTGLYNVHKMCYDGKIKFTQGNQSGHGLIYDYGWKIGPLKLKDFKNNLLKNNITEVQEFFKGPPAPVKPIKIKPIPKEKMKKMVDFWEVEDKKIIDAKVEEKN